ncbi:APC family permease [Francisellaceae bacterium]|nr:APC family permease [Francisellaceae bacterium]
MAVDTSKIKQPSLITAIGIGIGCMIGSGWLFAAYYASKYAGPAAYISWFIGAGLTLILALLLAEIACMYNKERSFFSRLFNISHKNQDFGFVIAISGWLGVVVTIPSEASATIQYLSTAFPSLTTYIYSNNDLTWFGIASVAGLMLIYMLVNYWGIRFLAKVNNAITVFKIIIPIMTAIILIVAGFHTSNFSSQGFAPNGFGKAITAVVDSGIFYAFYGFGMIAIFSSELKNPSKNIPIALITSVVLVLIIYLLLQTAFIGALPVDMVAKGWSNLDFTSPLVQVLLLFQINILALWATILYVDAGVSPSGTGIIYAGSASRMLTGMAKDKQAPAFFDKIHPIHNLSQRSLVFTILVCIGIVIFFKNWQEIMIVVTVFQLLSCMAIPVSFTKLRKSEPNKTRDFKVRGGVVLSYFIFIIVTYLLAQASTDALWLSLILHAVFFLFYGASYYKGNPTKVLRSLASSYSIFVYLGFSVIFGYFHEYDILTTFWGIALFIILTSINYYLLINQKSYNPQR